MTTYYFDYDGKLYAIEAQNDYEAIRKLFDQLEIDLNFETVKKLTDLTKDQYRIRVLEIKVAKLEELVSRLYN